MTQKLYEVDVLDHVEIRLSDGKKLSAKMSSFSGNTKKKY